MPKYNETYNDELIGVFLNNIQYGRTIITKEQMKRLVKIGFGSIKNNYQIEQNIKKIEKFYEKNRRLPELGERLGKEKEAVGDILFSSKVGTIRITEKQLLKLQSMGFELERGLSQKQTVLVKKISRNID